MHKNYSTALTKRLRWITLGVLLVATITHGAWLLVLQRQYRAEVELLKSQGYHVSMAEYRPAPLPESQNAAHIYAKAFPLINSQLNSRTDIDAMNTLMGISRFVRDTEPHSPDDVWAKANRAAKNLSSVVPLVKEALTRSECRFTINGQTQKSGKIRHHDGLISIVSILSGMAVVDAHEGRMEQAVDKIRMAFQVAQATKDEPSSTGVRTMLSATIEANKGLRSVMRYEILSARQCDEFNGLLAHTDYRPAHQAALIWDRAKGLDMYQTALSKGYFAACCEDEIEEEPSFSTRMFEYAMLPAIYADGLAYLKWMSTNIAMVAKPFPNAAQQRRMKKTAHDGYPTQLYSMVLFTPFPYTQRSLAVRADTALTQILIAAKRYKARHGQYPETMEQVRSVGVAEIPMDPFTGKDFSYKRTAKGFTVYSVGPDFIDDGGASWSPDHNRRDMVLRWEW